ncbi:aldo/keto reductase [Schumannella sp. 10F1B-5-1]|uniref:aldo/keto reductase n=1 Tax=Schumannella sp. 10F1B-5-1 TaxID=2590780 RepID=UPI0011300F16|nr:aldo/keto reductase [Schumannella sp. 10F1B-5-1]TPW73104.1 aldo/keto reductase [Schumannella sp. 10F1B-5-1]
MNDRTTPTPTPDTDAAAPAPAAPASAAPAVAPGGRFALGPREVARVGYGAMQLGGLPGRPPVSDADATAVLRRAVELGVDHIDTAQFYGDGVANQRIQAALGDTADVAIVSKVGAVHVADAEMPLAVAQKPAELRAQIEQNLRTLGRERLDLVNLRRVDAGIGIRATGDQLVPLDDQLAELIALRDAGTIGAIGLSNVDAAQLTQALPAGIAQVQNAYSLVARGDEDLLALTVQHGIAWVPFFPLGSAFPGAPKVAEQPAVQRVAAAIDATPAQVGLAWLLAHAPNVLLIPGTVGVDHLEQNVAAGAVALTTEQLAELDGVAEGIPA